MSEKPTEADLNALMKHNNAIYQSDIDKFWAMLDRCFKVEPREYFEKEARINGFDSPLAMACFYIWKREAKPSVNLRITAEQQANDEAALTAEFASLPRVDSERVAQLTAHRACTNEEHDPVNSGKLAGFCVVCGTPWPCEVAKPAASLPSERGSAFEEAAQIAEDNHDRPAEDIAAAIRARIGKEKEGHAAS